MTADCLTAHCVRRSLAALDGDTIDFTSRTGHDPAEYQSRGVQQRHHQRPRPEQSGRGRQPSTAACFSSALAKTVTISGLTISNGVASGSFPDSEGGGIYNQHATLT